MTDPYSRDGAREMAKSQEGVDSLSGLLGWYRALANAQVAIPHLENSLKEERQRVVTLKKFIAAEEAKLGIEPNNSDKFLGKTFG